MNKRIPLSDVSKLPADTKLTLWRNFRDYDRNEDVPYCLHLGDGWAEADETLWRLTFTPAQILEKHNDPQYWVEVVISSNRAGHKYMVIDKANNRIQCYCGPEGYADMKDQSDYRFLPITDEQYVLASQWFSYMEVV